MHFYIILASHADWHKTHAFKERKDNHKMNYCLVAILFCLNENVILKYFENVRDVIWRFIVCSKDVFGRLYINFS